MYMRTMSAFDVLVALDAYIWKGKHSIKSSCPTRSLLILPRVPSLRELSVGPIRIHRVGSPPLFRSPLHGGPSAFRHVHCKPDNQACGEAERKQEREAIPVVARSVDYRLDNVRPNY
jgi:hypothetical protein